MKNTSLALLILIFLFVLFILHKRQLKKYKKKDIADHYNVSRPTLQAWINYFPNLYSSNCWKSKRIFSAQEYEEIVESWGNDNSLVLTKKQLAAKTESTYKVLADNVKRNLTKIGISLEAWESCSKFPPIISRRIIEVMG